MLTEYGSDSRKADYDIEVCDVLIGPFEFQSGTSQLIR